MAWMFNDNMYIRRNKTEKSARMGKEIMEIKGSGVRLSCSCMQG
jgi:hypothetical protein